MPRDGWKFQIIKLSTISFVLLLVIGIVGSRRGRGINREEIVVVVVVEEGKEEEAYSPSDFVTLYDSRD